MKQSIKFFLATVLCFLALAGNAQNPFAGLEQLFTTPSGYIAGFTASAPIIDGSLDDKAWLKASWSNPFQDIEGELKPRPALQTKMKMVWNDTCLFVAAELMEPGIWATLKEHDDIVFRDNDFEIFIDPDNDTHQYYEIEVNALNTIFDLFLPKPYRNQSGAMINWDLAKLKSAVHINGTLNNAGDKDSSWTVEMAIPFRSIYFNNTDRSPIEGETWRINFSRVEWDTEIKSGRYVKMLDANGKVKAENNWVWSPQGVVNMHFPERWGYLQFTRKENSVISFQLPYAEKQKNFLWLCYYRQKSYAGKNGRYAGALADLGIESSVVVENHRNQLTMEATSRQFTVVISDENNNTVSINDDGLVRYRNNNIQR